MLTILLAVVTAQAEKCAPVRGYMTIDLTPRAKLEAEEAETAKLEVRAPRPLPFEALVVLKVDRLTIEAADPEHFTVVIFGADGTELYRNRGPNSVPNHNDLLGRWYDIWTAPIELGAKFPVDVHLVDNIADIKCAFRFDANGKGSKLKD